MLQGKQTKQCSLCSALINVSEYGDHVSSCSVDDEHPNAQLQRSNNDSNHNRNQFDEKTSSQVKFY